MSVGVQAAVLEELVRTRTSALLRTAFLLSGTHEGAQDLLQKALERVNRRLDQVRDPVALESYVRAAMATIASNDRRRLWRRESPVAVVPERGVADTADYSDTRLAVLGALRALPAAQRAVLVLRFYEDLTEAGTAAALGISTGTVKSRTSRALAALRASGIGIEERLSR
jgi:RNA polymerase sigma-70 factor (sigma-E family)